MVTGVSTSHLPCTMCHHGVASHNPFISPRPRCRNPHEKVGIASHRRIDLRQESWRDPRGCLLGEPCSCVPSPFLISSLLPPSYPRPGGSHNPHGMYVGTGRLESSSWVSPRYLNRCDRCMAHNPACRIFASSMLVRHAAKVLAF